MTDYIHDAVDGAPNDRFPLRRGELAMIAGFWLALAVVTAASRMFDPRGPGPAGAMASGFVALPFVESLLWALLTPGMFLLASRYGADRTDRLRTILLFVVVAVAAALLVNVVSTAFRQELFPAPRGRGGRGFGGRRGGGSDFGGRRLIERFALINHVIVAAAIIIAGFARDYSLRYRARKEQAARLQAQLAEARLDALRRQLDPHFLFNTLNAVSALVERDPRGVRRMIARLSELLRHSIEGSAEQELTLDLELELLQRYVDIMQVRFQGRLEVTMTADAAARAALVPNMILQPLVENAIKHGVGRLETAGHVAVEAEVAGDELRIRVRDDGPGLAAVAAGRPAPGDASTGLGLRNTRERLAQLYGAAQRFELCAGEDGGTVAELALPYHTRADLRAAVPNARGADGIR